MKKIIAASLLATVAALWAHASYATAPTSLETWVVTRMSTWSPPGRTTYKDALETEDEGKARYAQIAQDAISVVYDPAEPPIFSGDYARAKTLATLLSVALAESGFRKDVDLGIGAYAKGDGGRSWCLMQIQLGKAVNGKTPKNIALKGDGIEYVHDKSYGYGGEDLVADRKACLRVGLHVIRTSFSACSGLPFEERLSTYTSGNCEDGRGASRIRMAKATGWLSESAPPMKDVDVLAQMSP
jgi:hypothetical protein